MGTVVGPWRINIISIMFVLLTSVYVINGFLYDVETDENGYIVDTDTLGVNQTDEGIDEGQGFIDILFTIGDYLTFGNIDNMYARLFINMFVTVCWMLIGYVVYTFIKEWIPFV